PAGPGREAGGSQSVNARGLQSAVPRGNAPIAASTRTEALAMVAITQHEQQEIDAANASDKTPVVFVHGLWLLPSSWDRWRSFFEEAGFATLAPGWPDDP